MIKLFNCTGCGACCKTVGKAVATAKKLQLNHVNDYVDLVADFPFKTNEAGVCEKLLPDNTCAVYDARPLVCDVEKMYQKFYSDTLTREVYFDSSEQACRILESTLQGEIIEGESIDNLFISKP